MPSNIIQQNGGRVHGFQLWVNLPSRDKMTAPRYQEIPRHRNPEAVTPDGLTRVHVIAGEALGAKAVIETRTPIAFMHWILEPGASVDVPLPENYAAYVYVFAGKLRIGDREVKDGQLALLGDGASVHFEAAESAQALLLAGVPLHEPVVQYGPFVMNSEKEIIQAIRDYEAGRLGEISR
jgi:redox-sensitive bicupin YhaK (pirin superfamily)